MHNPDLAYLMGMIVGKGYKIQYSTETEYRIEIPHKLMKVEGMETNLSIRASLLEINQRLDPLINTRAKVSTESPSLTQITFRLSNASYLARELNRMLIYNNYKDFRIPNEIFNSTRDIKSEFMRGLSDVTGHIRGTNSAFGNPASHRVYIEIPSNWYLVVDICNLLKEVDVPVQNINWGHPNFRDGNLKDYNKGKELTWRKEHQIKIFADVFEKVGFNIIHKKLALEDFAQTNRDNYNAPTKTIEESHNPFYWEKPIRRTRRGPHPMVNHESIPPILRGQNFESWTDVARILGYHE